MKVVKKNVVNSPNSSSSYYNYCLKTLSQIDELVGFGMDHQALLWCYQVQDKLALALQKLLALPVATPPGARIDAVRSALFAATTKDGAAAAAATAAAEAANTADPTPSSVAVAWAAGLLDWASDVVLGMTTHRLWMVVPVWTAVGLLCLAAPMLHALLGVSVQKPASARVLTIMPPPADVFGSPALHWPTLLVAPTWAAASDALVGSSSSSSSRRGGGGGGGAVDGLMPPWARKFMNLSLALYALGEAVKLGETLGWVPPLWEMLLQAVTKEEEDQAQTEANEEESGERSLQDRAVALALWILWWAWDATVGSGAALLSWAAGFATLPGQLLVHGAAALVRTALPPLVAYAALLPCMGVFARAAAAAQAAADVARRAAEESLPGRLLGRFLSAVSRGGARVLSCVPGFRGSKKAGGSSDLSGDEQREEFRRRQRDRAAHPSAVGGGAKGEGAGGGWLSWLTWGDGFLGLHDGEARLASVLAATFLALHVESLPIQLPEFSSSSSSSSSSSDGGEGSRPPIFKLRVLLSLDRSLAHELSIVTLFAAGTAGALLCSFVVLPPRGRRLASRSNGPAAELAKYQLLLFVAYLPPLVPLCYGAVRHAMACLARRPSASALAYSSAAALTFDTSFDALLLLCVALHVFYARYRRLLLPRVLDGAPGLFALPSAPKPLLTAGGGGGGSGGNGGIDAAAAAEVGKDLVLGDGAAGGSVSSSSSSSSSVLGSTLAAEAVVGAGRAAWRRIWQWRTGETYYENVETGDLLYPDGGSRAIFEETAVDSFDVGGGVTIGPAFKVRKS